MTDEEKIVARILDVIPPRSFELTTFLSLFRVRFSEKTKTACVTCGESPELLLNKDFIEAHCQTNEHLFMLVMHELYHVILGHTTLFPRATEVRNIVFDAVINAILCSLFPKPEFTSFFTDYYPSDKMPSALLRPKGEGTPLAAELALKLLYGGSDTGTYHDVYEALLKSGCIKEIKLVVKSDGEDGEPLLLGSHDEENEEISQEMKDLIHKIISKWPSPDRPLQGQDLGAEECERGFDAEADPTTRLRRGIRRLMRRAAIPGKKEVRRRSVREMVCEQHDNKVAAAIQPRQPAGVRVLRRVGIGRRGGAVRGAGATALLPGRTLHGSCVFDGRASGFRPRPRRPEVQLHGRDGHRLRPQARPRTAAQKAPTCCRRRHGRIHGQAGRGACSALPGGGNAALRRACQIRLRLQPGSRPLIHRR